MDSSLLVSCLLPLSKYLWLSFLLQHIQLPLYNCNSLDFLLTPKITVKIILLLRWEFLTNSWNNTDWNVILDCICGRENMNEWNLKHLLQLLCIASEKGMLLFFFFRTWILHSLPKHNSLGKPTCFVVVFLICQYPSDMFYCSSAVLLMRALDLPALLQFKHTWTLLLVKPATLCC